jgi:hypothetical protein
MPRSPRSIFVFLITTTFFACSACDSGDRASTGPEPTNTSSPSGYRYAPQISNEVVRAARREGVDIEALIITTMEKVHGALPGPIPEVDVTAHDGSPPTGAVGGFSNPYGGDISIKVYPDGDNVRKTLRVWVPPTVAHEMHHSSRILAGPGYGSTLLEAFVTEGLAQHFAEEMFPTTPKPPWYRELSLKQERALWKRAKRRLHDTSYDHDVWFHGAGQIPPDAGYSIGYNLVELFLSRQHATAAEEVLTSAERIYQISDYFQRS